MDVINLLNNINNQINVTNQMMLENFEFLERSIYGTRKHTVFPRVNPFDRYDDNEFCRRYRLSKEQVNQLYDMIDGENSLEPLVCFFFLFIPYFTLILCFVFPFHIQF